MKKIRTKLFRKWILILSPLFTACNFSGVYGPGGIFDGAVISGKVTDVDTGDGIKDIVVSLLIDVDGVKTLSEVVTTQEDGGYGFMIDRDADDSIQVEIKVDDVDGDNNGGTYISASELKTVDMTSDSRVVVDCDIALDKAE